MNRLSASNDVPRHHQSMRDHRRSANGRGSSRYPPSTSANRIRPFDIDSNNSNINNNSYDDGHDNNIAIDSEPSASRDNVLVWKAATVMLVGFIVLMFTGVMEIEQTNFADGDVIHKPHEDGVKVDSGSLSDQVQSDFEKSKADLAQRKSEYNQRKKDDEAAQAQAQSSLSDRVATTAATTSAAANAPATPGAAADQHPADLHAQHFEASPYEYLTTYSEKGDVRFFTYEKRGAPYYNDAEREEIKARWGSWSWDDEPERPKADFYKAYPNRDVPWKEFPIEAWQKDKEYMERFLREAKQLVVRAMEAILAEYGHGKDENASGDDRAARSDMFAVKFFEDDDLANAGKDSNVGHGGWTTPKSWEGLKRRLLHAIITEDSFNFAMGGHSAAAGHGNHFQQSYTLQVAKIMEPVFARLGVRHTSRNFGNGGLGTGHNAIAAGDIYGDNAIVMWDSGMTEKGPRDPDLMARQSLIGGPKVPVLWSFPRDVLVKLHGLAGVHIGMNGSAGSGVPEATTSEELDAQPYAVQALDCARSIREDFCKRREYNGKCWMDRKDLEPPHKQKRVPQGRTSWHPGNKVHQIRGRVLAFTLLKALEEVIDTWSAADDYAIPDEEWHVTKLYETTRKKVLDIKPEDSPCYNLGDRSPGFEKLCYLPMKGRTEFTPRANPEYTSLRSIMPPEELQYINPPPPSFYMPPDVFQPRLHPPKDDIDVLTIIEGGPSFRPNRDPIHMDTSMNEVSNLPAATDIGKGTYLHSIAGYCDGTMYSWCDKSDGQECLLSRHNDRRNGLAFDGKSGWMVFNVPKVKHGLIIVKLETWYKPGSNPKTIKWTTVNNKPDSSNRRRQLSAQSPVHAVASAGDADETAEMQNPQVREIAHPAGANNTTTSVSSDRKLARQGCVDYTFDYSIDGGDIISLNDEEYMARRFEMQRVVELMKILDDPSHTGGADEERDVQVKIRLTGCANFKLTHLYWS